MDGNLVVDTDEHKVIEEGCGCITVHKDGWLAIEHGADAGIVISRDGSLTVSPKLPWDGDVGNVLEKSIIIKPPAEQRRLTI